MSRPEERKRIIVGCDLDDVLADFMPKFIEMASERFGIPENKILRPIDWAWSNMGWSREQQDQLWQQLHDTVDFWTTLDPLPGVNKDLVRELSLRTVMYFPTARAQSIGYDVAFQSARWLLNTFQVSFPTVIVSNEKGPLASALKYDYFIDDRPKNCYEVKAARPECQVFLADATHNQDESTSTICKEIGISRISGFNEFANLIMGEK